MAAKKNDSTVTGGFERPAWVADYAGLTEDDARALFPRYIALINSWDKVDAPALRITSRVAGFRRGGVAHPAEPINHDFLSFSPAQVEQMLEEPMLIVELVEAPAAPDAPAAAE